MGVMMDQVHPTATIQLSIYTWSETESATTFVDLMRKKEDYFLIDILTR